MGSALILTGRPPHGRAPERQARAGHSLDRPCPGRSRTARWPAKTGIDAPKEQPEVIGERFLAVGARTIHHVDSYGAQRGRPVNMKAVGQFTGRVAVSLQGGAGGLKGADNIQLAVAAGATRLVLAMGIADDPPALRACVEVAGCWLAVGLDPRSDRVADYPWMRPDRPGFDDVTSEPVGLGVRRVVLSQCGSAPDLTPLERLVHHLDVEVLIAGRVTGLAAIRRRRDTDVTGIHLGEVLLTSCVQCPSAMAAAV